MTRDRLGLAAACASLLVAVVTLIGVRFAYSDQPADMGEGFLLLAICVFAAAAWTWRRVLQNPTDESRRATGVALLVGPWALTAFLVGAALLEARFGYPGD